MNKTRSSTSASRRFTPRALALAIAAAAGTTTALAGPEGGTVVAGSADITRNGLLTTIQQHSRDAVINYNSFNVARNETVNFIQPSASSRILNRISGAAPTSIDGTLTANGRVFFVNPAGIMFGATSVIDVGRIYAGAGSISNADFFRGVDRASNLRGDVTNHGMIHAREGVVLEGRTVVNTGSISSPQGYIVMAAGEDALVGTRGSRIFARVTPPRTAQQGGPRAELADALRNAPARDMFASALWHSGSIEASSVTLDAAGKGSTTTVTGSIDAGNTSGRGGTVRVLADRVVLDGASLNASGATGGGEVYIGGNFHGAGAERNASTTIVTAASTINADAIASGNGGRVALWSDKNTGYAGSISARGGSTGGDGGFIEVSGKQNLLFRGDVNASAPNGKAGTLLLDPLNITIEDGGAATIPLSNIVTFDTDELTDYSMDADIITAIANAGTDVELQANNTITVNEAITVNNADDQVNNGNGGNITFRAGNSIIVNEAITTDNGNLTLVANDSTSQRANRSDANAGVITLDAPVNVGSGTLSLSVNAADAAGTAGDITQAAALTANLLTVSTSSLILLDNPLNNAVAVHLETTAGPSDRTTTDVPFEIEYADADAVRVDGIIAPSADARIVSGGTMSQGTGNSERVEVRWFAAETTNDSNLILTNLSNSVDALRLRSRNSANTALGDGEVRFHDSNGFSIGLGSPVIGFVGVESNANVTLVAGDNVTQLEQIVADHLSVTTRNDAGASITLNDLANDTNSVSLRTLRASDLDPALAVISFTNGVGDLVVGGSTAGGFNYAIDTTGAVTLSTVNGDIRQNDTTYTVGSLRATSLDAVANRTSGGGGVVDLGEEANSISGTAILSSQVSGGNGSGAVSFYRDGVLDFGDNVIVHNLTGALALFSNDAITQSASISNTSLIVRTYNANGADITLDNAGNAVGTLTAETLTARGGSGANADITFTNSADLILGVASGPYSDETAFAVRNGSDVSNTTDISTNGRIRQSSGYHIAGGHHTYNTIDGSDASIILTDAANNVSAASFFTTINTSLAGGVSDAVSYTDLDGYELRGITTDSSVTLRLTSGGTVTQAAGLGNAIRASSNDSGVQSLTLMGNGNFALTNGIADATSTGANRAQSLAGSVSGNVTYFDSGTIHVNSGVDATSTGGVDASENVNGLAATDVTLRAANNITQAQFIQADDLSARSVGGTIDLRESDNHSNTIAFNAGAGAGSAPNYTVRYNDNAGFQVLGINTVGDTELTAAGNISQGSSSSNDINTRWLAVTARAGSGPSIELSNNDNSVAKVSLRSLASGGGTGSGAITFHESDGFRVGVESNGIASTGSVSLESGGNIGQDQIISAGDLSVIAKNNTTIDLTLANLASSIHLESLGTAPFQLGTGSMSYTDADSVAVRGITNDLTNAATQLATIRTLNGAITQGGAAGDAIVARSLDARANGSAGTIDLRNTGNNTGWVTFTTTGTNAAGPYEVDYTDATAGFVVNGISTAANGNVRLTSNGAGIVGQGVSGSDAISASTLSLFGASTNFELRNSANDVNNLAGSALSFNYLNSAAGGPLTLGIAAGAGDIASSLAATNNIFITAQQVTQSLGSIQGNTVDCTTLTVDAANGIDLGLDNTAEFIDLAATAGNIAYTGANSYSVIDLDTPATAALTSALGQSVTQANAATDDTNSITAVDLVLAGQGSFDLQGIDNTVTRLSGAVDAPTGAADITFHNDGALVIGTNTTGLSADGTISLTTATGDITQNSAIFANSLIATSATSITLANSNNHAESVNLTSTTGGDITYTDFDALDLAGISSTNGTAAITTGGAISQSGTINVGNTGSFHATSAGAITLDNPANQAGSIALTSSTGGAISYTDANSINLAGISTTGNVSITTVGAGGTVTDSAATAASLLIVHTNAADIVLDHAGNNASIINLSINGASRVRDITYNDVNGFDIASLANARVATLSANANSAVSQSGAISVQTLSVAGDADFSLTRSDNSIRNFHVTDSDVGVTLRSGGRLNLVGAVPEFAPPPGGLPTITASFLDIQTSLAGSTFSNDDGFINVQNSIQVAGDLVLTTAQHQSPNAINGLFELPQLVFGRDVSSLTSSSGAIRFNTGRTAPADANAVPAIATIVAGWNMDAATESEAFTHAVNDSVANAYTLTINAAGPGGFHMGDGADKFVVLGNLDINAGNRAVTLGDVNAAGRLRVTSGTLNVSGRPVARFRNSRSPNGDATDSSTITPRMKVVNLVGTQLLDLQNAGTISLPSDTTLRLGRAAAGGLILPTGFPQGGQQGVQDFSFTGAAATANANVNLSMDDLWMDQTSNLFAHREGSTVPQIGFTDAKGTTSDNVAEALAGISAITLPRIAAPTVILSSEIEDFLKELDINVRPARVLASRQSRSGLWDVYNDSPRTNASKIGATDIEISPDRLRENRLETLIRLDDEYLRKLVIGDDDAFRNQAIENLQSCYLEFVDARPSGSTTGADFARELRERSLSNPTPPQRHAWGSLRTLHRAFEYIDDLGLSSQEAIIMKTNILEKLETPDVTSTFLMDAVNAATSAAKEGT